MALANVIAERQIQHSCISFIFIFIFQNFMVHKMHIPTVSWYFRKGILSSPFVSDSFFLLLIGHMTRTHNLMVRTRTFFIQAHVVISYVYSCPTASMICPCFILVVYASYICSTSNPRPLLLICLSNHNVTLLVGASLLKLKRFLC